jgi:hypothetical protein
MCFNWSGLTRNGSISRGVSFGNGQDVVVNSTLNLQLSGRLSEDVEVLAAITDNNIPIQPDGNTQQIQEFDKVFIQLFNDNHRLTAGDFELKRPASYFMNFYKKAQGGMLTSGFDLRSSNKEKKAARLTISGAGAVSRGKYARNVIQGTEGNQGPYRLTGANNETYIIVLAGTEKVYVDGRLLMRGQEKDYVIDYNLGEITFMPALMISREKRIVVEFEYSDRNYGRSLFFVSTEAAFSNGALRFAFFSEQDLKTQPLQQELDEDRKKLLADIGDSLQLALIPAFDSVGFNTDEVLYRMKDSLVGGILYDSVFVYSTNPDSAYYRLGFSYLGPGKGNYVQAASAANGRVFRWVALRTECRAAPMSR